MARQLTVPLSLPSTYLPSPHSPCTRSLLTLNRSFAVRRHRLLLSLPGMPSTHVERYSGSPPMKIVRVFASKLQRVEDRYTALETKLREISVKKGCNVEDLLPLLYSEHWEPLRKTMWAVVGSPKHVRQTWVDDEIEDVLQNIPYVPIRRELEERWQKFKVTTEAAVEEGKNIRSSSRTWGANNLEEAERVGRVMSDEQRERAFTLMVLHKGKPEDFSWEDAVMAVWEEEIAAMVIQAEKPSKGS